jgi:hypothetical protein
MVIDKSFIMLISKNNTDLSETEALQWRKWGDCKAWRHDPGSVSEGRCKHAPLHAVIVAVFAPRVVVTVVVPRRCCHPYTACGVVVAVVVPHVMSQSQSSHHMVLRLWWLLLCHSYGYRRLHILMAMSLLHIITIMPLSLWLVVGGCAMVGPGGRGWPCIC